MELTTKERLSLINQFKILEALYPTEAEYYANNRRALEGGYTLHYEWLVENLSSELSADQCREVLDILDMYRAITHSISRLEDGDILRQHHNAKFSGFDGNNESQLMGYVRYFIVDLDRYPELRDSEYPNFNSHTRMLDRYRTMLARWRPSQDRFNLGRDQLANILGA